MDASGCGCSSAWCKHGERGQQPERSWTHQAVGAPPTCYRLGMRGGHHLSGEEQRVKPSRVTAACHHSRAEGVWE